MYTSQVKKSRQMYFSGVKLSDKVFLQVFSADKKSLQFDVKLFLITIIVIMFDSGSPIPFWRIVSRLLQVYFLLVPLPPFRNWKSNAKS